VKKRGDDYDEVKKAIGSQMVEQACALFPQTRDRIVYTEIGIGPFYATCRYLPASNSIRFEFRPGFMKNRCVMNMMF